LQDFKADFYIIASNDRRRQFDDVISSSIYNPIRNTVKFTDYDTLVNQYTKMFELLSIKEGI